MHFTHIKKFLTCSYISLPSSLLLLHDIIITRIRRRFFFSLPLTKFPILLLFSIVYCHSYINTFSVRLKTAKQNSEHKMWKICEKWQITFTFYLFLSSFHSSWVPFSILLPILFYFFSSDFTPETNKLSGPLQCVYFFYGLLKILHIFGRK